MNSVRAVVIAFVCSLLAPGLALALPSHSAAIGMTAEVGWNGSYRTGGAWAPVHVTLNNPGTSTVAGMVQIPDHSISAAVSLEQPALAIYRTPVILPAGASKSVTLYLPGSDIQGEIDVEFTVGGSSVAVQRVFPIPFEDRDLSIGAVAADPADVSWLKQLRVPHARVRILDLSTSALDPRPEALAGLDLVVLSDVNSSSLDAGQISAITEYVQEGGALLLIGGPAWQQTLSPLPSDLLTGTLAGTQTVNDLNALRALGVGSPAPGPAVVSVLNRPEGAVLAAQGGVPLVVRHQKGAGQVEYLAFDPSLAPFSSWSGSTTLFTSLVEGVMTGAMQRLSLPSGNEYWSRLQPPPGPVDPAQELISGSGATLPSAPLLAVVLTVYLLVVGGATLIAQRLALRRHLPWLSIPIIAVLLAAALPNIASPGNVQRGALRVVGVVDLADGTAGQSATLYAGVSAPTGQQVQLTYNGSALPLPVVPVDRPGSEPSLFAGPDSQTKLQWGLTEGSISTADVPSIALPQSRVVELKTSSPIHGTLQSALRVNQQGEIQGTVQNGTGHYLRAVALLAGQRVDHLPNLAPGQTVSVRVRPAINLHDHSDEQTLFDVYGQPPLDNGASDGLSGPLKNRIWWALSALPEARVAAADSEVQFFAWSTDPLHAFSVSPSGSQQALLLVHGSLQVQLGSGQVHLRIGTFGAHLTDEVPSQPQFACCIPLPQAVFIGAGGRATFEFDLPITPRTSFSQLFLHVYGGGDDPTYTDYTGVPRGAASAYDWTSSRWVRLTFKHDVTQLRGPGRFVSRTGAVLVRLHASDSFHELTIADPLRDIQLYGTAST